MCCGHGARSEVDSCQLNFFGPLFLNFLDPPLFAVIMDVLWSTTCEPTTFIKYDALSGGLPKENKENKVWMPKLLLTINLLNDSQHNFSKTQEVSPA